MQATTRANELIKETLATQLEGQITDFEKKVEADAISQKTKVATAFDEIAARFPRRRYLNKKEKKEHQVFLST